MQCRPFVATVLVFSLFTVVCTALLATRAGALIPDGYIFYQTAANNVIQGDNYTSSDFTPRNETLQNVGGVPAWIAGQWSRHRNESIVVTFDAGNDINFVATNMTSKTTIFTAELTAISTSVNYPSDDVAYESVSGDGLVVFDNNTNNALISYSVWNGTTLSVNGTVALGTTATTGSRFIRLIPDPHSDNIMMIHQTNVGDVGAALWNGTGFEAVTTATIGLVAGTLRRPFDFAWNPNGNGVLFFANQSGTVGHMNFTVSSKTWSLPSAVLNLGAQAVALDACGNPNNNYIGVITTDNLTDGNVFIWNGTAMETSPARPAEETTVEAAGHNSKCEWERSGTQAIFVFVASNELNLTYVHYNLSANLATRVWSSATLINPVNGQTPAVGGDDIETLKMRASPYSDAIMITFKDLLTDIRSVVWNGATIAPATANYIIEQTSTTANAPSFDFIWNRFPSNPPVIRNGINDSSNTTSPTNNNSNVTFTVNATDIEGDQYYLLICSGLPGELNGTCYSTTVCTSALTASSNIASCQFNTSGQTAESYSWYGYVCDNSSVCNTIENSTAPYNVNHPPTINSTTLVPAPPLANVSSITCSNVSSDPDVGDTVSPTYLWYIRNESSGSFGLIPAQTSDHINNTVFDSNDQVFCSATAIDNHGYVGNSTNSSVTTVQNGTLTIASNLNESAITAYQSALLNVNCTVASGDSEAVTLTIYDNHTGTMTQSSTTPAAVYVNASSISLGRIASATVSQNILVSWQTFGSYNFSARCTASDTNITIANSSTHTLTIAPFTATPTNPANDTSVDRDQTQPTTDIISLTVTVPAHIPNGAQFSFLANLTSPSIGGQTAVLLGTNTTSGGTVVLHYNPNATSYAGNWTWYVTNANATMNTARNYLSFGQLTAVFRSATSNPGSSYTINQSATIEANVTSLGPETTTQLNSTYGITVNNGVENHTATSTVSMSYVNPYWQSTHSMINLLSIGLRNITVNASGPFWFSSSDLRTATITSFMNITNNTTSPAAIPLNGFTTTSCRAIDEFTQHYISGVNITFYRNSTYMGSNLTNGSGHASLSFQTTSYGDYAVTCNITTPYPSNYAPGAAPSGVSLFNVVSMPPSFVTDVTDLSNATSPTNHGMNITFTANATDPEAENWKLVICGGSAGITNASCTGTPICSSGFVPTDQNATCDHNTTGELLQQYSWWGYACDISNACSAYNNTSSPYDVNHEPTVSPSLNNYTPSFSDIITCSSGSSDPDLGDFVNNVFSWFRQDEGIGAFVVIPGESSNQLEPPAFDSNDEILCQVSPTDNHGFLGVVENSTSASIQSGTMDVLGSLNTTNVFRTQQAEFEASCIIEDGDSEDVVLTIEDDSTGSFAESSTTPADVYVNASSMNLGSIYNNTVTRRILISTQAAGTYQFRAVCTSSDTPPGTIESTPETLQVDLDTTGPVISNISVEPTIYGATVSWNTDDLSDSEVDYGENTTMSSSVFNPANVRLHSVVLSTLTANTLHYYNITSCNVDNYCTTSGPHTFSTLTDENEANAITGGYCTAVIVERHSNASGDAIGEGDIVEFYCELPNRVYEREDFTITVTNKDKQTQKEIEMPDPIFGTQVPLYP